ncbi:hypothetical protein, partial [Rubritalea tangerina]|uniref:hypothetical protein n=1 Tax=Rubritalea tangerina TaxID=430798 RepID=UPI00362465ED
DLPDMQSCLVNVGDEVREGQALYGMRTRKRCLVSVQSLAMRVRSFYWLPKRCKKTKRLRLLD